MSFHLSCCFFYLILGYVYCQADYAVPYHNLPMIDQHALFQLENFTMNIKVGYEKYQFFKIFQVNIF
jgi:isoleucyl-tRNA synthetase